MSLGPRPRIFISSVSKELHNVRQLVANSLQFLGYEPVWQDIFGTEHGDLRQVLISKIDECEGVIQIVGKCYGFEPPTPDEQFGRVSYTQFEALYAESRHKKVWYQLLDESFPNAIDVEEPQELRSLQAAYRKRVQQGRELYYVVRNSDGLEANVLKLRNDLALLRKGMRRWSIALAIAVLVLLCIGTWLAMEQGSASKKISLTKSTVDVIDTTVGEVNAHVRALETTPAISSENLIALLASADADQLTRFQSAGVTVKQFAQAFAQLQATSKKSVARLFFEASKDSEAAINWFKGILKCGLDPNLLIDDDLYEHHGMLRDALAAENAPAVLVLLEAGASPHPYQNLWFSPYALPTFLFPYAALSSSHFAVPERQQIAQAMQRAGAVVMRYKFGAPNKPDFIGITAQMQAAEQTIEESSQKLGQALVETPEDSQSRVSPIAEQATRATGFNWVDLVEQVPSKIEAADLHDAESMGLWWVEIRNLINVTNGAAYFLGTALCDRPQYALIEVPKDNRDWAVYVFIEPKSGKGFCHCMTEDNDKEPPSRCWRKFTITYDPDSKHVKVDNYYDWHAIARQ